MDLYLMQHGEAVAAEVDPERPLTQEGAEHVRAVAARAAAAGVRIERIVHSGKLRAGQTASLVGEHLHCPRVDAVGGLKPGDAVQAAREALLRPGGPDSLAIVGHLPFLDRFASLLVTGDADAGVLAFRNAALVKLVPSGAHPGRFRVAWVLPPELAG
jgi:phosphohistidine phosphatase